MRTRRKKARVNAGRWAAYAVAAAAGATLGPQGAEADITLFEPNLQLRDSTPDDGYLERFDIPVLNPGNSLLFHVGYDSFRGYGFLFLRGSTSNSPYTVNFVGQAGGNYFYASNLDYGVNISTLDRVDTTFRNTLYIAWRSGFENSQFINTGGYIGFSFDIGNGTQFGWAELQLDSGAPQNFFTLVRYAFADPGESLFVGEVPSAIPEPGSLGLLAMGAAGLIAWRRKRNATRFNKRA